MMLRKGYRIYVLVSVIALLIMFTIAPYLFKSSSGVLKQSRQLQASPKDVFAELENVRTWRNWAWPLSRENVEVIWYDKTVGELAGFYWEANEPQIGDGVGELISVNPPYEIVCQYSLGDGNNFLNHFYIEALSDSTSLLEWELQYEVDAYPWDRWGFWIKANTIKKRQLESMDSFSNLITASE